MHIWVSSLNNPILLKLLINIIDYTPFWVQYLVTQFVSTENPFFVEI